MPIPEEQIEPEGVRQSIDEILGDTNIDEADEATLADLAEKLKAAGYDLDADDDGDLDGGDATAIAGDAAATLETIKAAYESGDAEALLGALEEVFGPLEEGISEEAPDAPAEPENEAPATEDSGDEAPAENEPIQQEAAGGNTLAKTIASLRF
jgi:hypothetical protein